MADDASGAVRVIATAPEGSAPAVLVASWLFAELADLGVAVRVAGEDVVLDTVASRAGSTHTRIVALLGEARFAGWRLADA